MSGDAPDRASTARPLATLGVALLAGGLAASAAIAVAGGGAHRLASAYLIGFIFVWTITLGSLFLLALAHVTNAIWSIVIRRTVEMMAQPVWLAAALFAPLVVAGVYAAPDLLGLFPWVHGREELNASKQIYLDTTFYTARQVLYFGLWTWFALFFVGRSLRQDRGDPEGAIAGRMRAAAAPFLIVFAFTLTFAAYDWILSLEPHWHSTIFGVYVFSGMAVTSVAAVTLLVLWLRSRGFFGDVAIGGDHLYSLGALLFAFTCFWAYIAFSQFMLIWYGNIPDETDFYLHRVEPRYLAVTVLLPIVRFAVPFAVLLSRRAKMAPSALVPISCLVLAGQFLDLCWLISPHTSDQGIGWQETGPALAMTGALLLTIARFVRRRPPVPAGDPRFDASRRFRL